MIHAIHSKAAEADWLITASACLWSSYSYFYEEVGCVGNIIGYNITLKLQVYYSASDFLQTDLKE